MQFEMLKQTVLDFIIYIYMNFEAYDGVKKCSRLDKKNSSSHENSRSHVIRMLFRYTY